MSLQTYYQTCAFKKPPTRKSVTRARRRLQSAVSQAVHDAVMVRDRDRCRVCGRRAESTHELRFRSLGGKRSLENTIATCGSGTSKCHGALQTHRIRVTVLTLEGANGALGFDDRRRPKTRRP